MRLMPCLAFFTFFYFFFTSTLQAKAVQRPTLYEWQINQQPNNTLFFEQEYLDELNSHFSSILVKSIGEKIFETSNHCLKNYFILSLIEAQQSNKTDNLFLPVLIEKKPYQLLLKDFKKFYLHKYCPKSSWINLSHFLEKIWNEKILDTHQLSCEKTFEEITSYVEEIPYLCQKNHLEKNISPLETLFCKELFQRDFSFPLFCQKMATLNFWDVFLEKQAHEVFAESLCSWAINFISDNKNFCKKNKEFFQSTRCDEEIHKKGLFPLISCQKLAENFVKNKSLFSKGLFDCPNNETISNNTDYEMITIGRALQQFQKEVQGPCQHRNKKNILEILINNQKERWWPYQYCFQNNCFPYLATHETFDQSLNESKVLSKIFHNALKLKKEPVLLFSTLKDYSPHLLQFKGNSYYIKENIFSHAETPLLLHEGRALENVTKQLQPIPSFFAFGPEQETQSLSSILKNSYHFNPMKTLTEIKLALSQNKTPLIAWICQEFLTLPLLQRETLLSTNTCHFTPVLLKKVEDNPLNITIIWAEVPFLPNFILINIFWRAIYESALLFQKWHPLNHWPILQVIKK